jgi:hypothetical protein
VCLVPALSSSDWWIIAAIEELGGFLRHAVGIDDQIVEFTRMGGWHKINKVLLLPSIFDHIFDGGWNQGRDWVLDLGEIAADLKVGQLKFVCLSELSFISPQFRNIIPRLLQLCASMLMSGSI